MKATTDFLIAVVERKRLRLADSIISRPLDQVRVEAYQRRSVPGRAFRSAFTNDETNSVIAEIKRASPSKGELSPGDISPSGVARAYERGGAAAISVLTEQDYFRGSLNDLTEVREAVSLPVLRKDFIFDEYQLYESAAAGADAVLLITALLDEPVLKKLRQITEEELGMDALVEVHDLHEMELAKSSGATLIGVNNRNLRTFNVSLDASFDLAPLKPTDGILISESGLGNAEQLKRLHAVGYRGFLIGEKFMRSNDPEADLRTIIKEAEN
jgi:indole-3-glycerol phosphate synthase